MPKTLFWTAVKRGYDEHKRGWQLVNPMI
jgi:hypothetical protein